MKSEYERVKAFLNSEYGLSVTKGQSRFTFINSNYNDLKDSYNELKESYSDTDCFKNE